MLPLGLNQRPRVLTVKLAGLPGDGDIGSQRVGWDQLTK
jgi:hypothetical protein